MQKPVKSIGITIALVMNTTFMLTKSTCRMAVVNRRILLFNGVQQERLHYSTEKHYKCYWLDGRLWALNCVLFTMRLTGGVYPLPSISLYFKQCQ